MQIYQEQLQKEEKEAEEEEEVEEEEECHRVKVYNYIIHLYCLAVQASCLVTR